MALPHRPLVLRWVLLTGVLAGALAGEARAQAQTETTQDPPKARIARAAPRQTVSLTATAPGAPAATAATPGEAQLTLRIAYKETTIRNPATKQLDKVKLRTYINEGDPDNGTPLIAPTIEVFPGETVRITLKNELPDEPDCEPKDIKDINKPHCFNTTNLHGHGLAVSPSGNSDNVLISIKPKVTFQYEYNIPADHPSGTFWYHPHRHGSTAIQVSSGMAGALIIRGTRLPTPDATGDVDTLLRNRDGSPMLERLLVMQQIQYACRKEDGTIKTNDDGTWKCDPEDVGGIESYEFGSWVKSGRYTTVNGRTSEPLAQKATVGKVERWRFVHAGVRNTIRAVIRKRLPGTGASYAGLSARAQADWIDTNCEKGDDVPQWQIAADGLTTNDMERRSIIWLQPGYRVDTLVVFPSAGEYCVIDEPAPPAQSVNGEDAGRQLLTLVTADGDTTITNIYEHLRQELRASAESFMPEDVRKSVLDWLGPVLMRLSKFVPHADMRGTVSPSKLQHLMFGFPAGVGTDTTNVLPYLPGRTDRLLTLGAVEDWRLTSRTSGHPFHIHVNPFQVLSITHAKGHNLNTDPDSEYYHMSGQFKDTVFVQEDVRVEMRTRYERYIGDFVLHCHILDHEDQGMMQNVRIALPDGKGGQAPATHDSMTHKPPTKTSDNRP